MQRKQTMFELHNKAKQEHAKLSHRSPIQIRPKKHADTWGTRGNAMWQLAVPGFFLAISSVLDRSHPSPLQNLMEESMQSHSENWAQYQSQIPS